MLHPQAIKVSDPHCLWTSDSDSRSEGLPLPLPALSYGSESSTQKFPLNKADSILVIQKPLPDVGCRGPWSQAILIWAEVRKAKTSSAPSLPMPLILPNLTHSPEAFRK